MGGTVGTVADGSHGSPRPVARSGVPSSLTRERLSPSCRSRTPTCSCSCPPRHWPARHGVSRARAISDGRAAPAAVITFASGRRGRAATPRSATGRDRSRLSGAERRWGRPGSQRLSGPRDDTGTRCLVARPIRVTHAPPDQGNLSAAGPERPEVACGRKGIHAQLITGVGRCLQRRGPWRSGSSAIRSR